jgi:predicted Ser/Thr protein kinase
MAYRDDEEAARAQIEALAQDRRAQERRLAAITTLCGAYIKNVCAWAQTDATGDQVVPDEQLMRSIEDRTNLGDARRDAFRREIALFVDALSIEGKPFEFRMHAALHKALELVVAERATEE